MSANPHVELIARLRRTIPGVDGKGRVIPCLVNPDGPQAADALEAATPSERELRLEAALKVCDDAIKEMFRYYDGGETRGSYDGKPERAQLRKAGYAARTALEPGEGK